MTRLAAVAVLAAVLACKSHEAPATPPPPPPSAPPSAPPATPPPATPPATPPDKAPPPEATPAPTTSHPLMDAALAGKPLQATIQTSMGDITVELYSKDAPKTVANFVGLASGEKPWTDPRTGQPQNKPLYDGTIFHRVIPGFMIQGGDPLGNGAGDPGYRFEDEFQSGRAFDHKGLLAMANAGPNTNGSQFFITVAPTPHLTGHHTIFGNVTKGYDVVEKIANTPRDARDRPLQAVSINRITVTEPKH